MGGALVRKSRIRHRRGYTLIEAMITMVVAGILMTMGVAQLAPTTVNYRVRAATNVLAGDLQYAQVLAARFGRPIVVIVVPSTKQLIIRDLDTPPNLYRTRLLGQVSEYALDNLTSTPADVMLFPNGVNQETMTITLGLLGFERQVRMTRAGQIRIIVP